MPLSSAHALGSIIGVSPFINIDKQLHKTKAPIFPMQAMVP